MEQAMDINSAIFLVVVILGSIVTIGSMIILIVFTVRKTTRKDITTQGTDKSVFAKHIMDEYHEERTRDNGI